MKLTGEQIKQALERYASKFKTAGFVYIDADGTYLISTQDILDLINRLEAEKEELVGKLELEKGKVKRLKEELKTVAVDQKVIKSFAIKEFTDRLKEEDSFECDVSLGYGRPCYEDVVPIIAIDNLVKEMTGARK